MAYSAAVPTKAPARCAAWLTPSRVMADWTSSESQKSAVSKNVSGTRPDDAAPSEFSKINAETTPDPPSWPASECPKAMCASADATATVASTAAMRVVPNSRSAAGPTRSRLTMLVFKWAQSLWATTCVTRQSQDRGLFTEKYRHDGLARRSAVPRMKTSTTKTSTHTAA